jgi:hypothetical protein
MSVSPIDIQKILFNQIKEQCSDSLVEEVSEVLNISPDSAYRRIRNEKALTFDEVARLSQKYNISLDALVGLVGKIKVVPFLFPFKNQDFDFKDYLESILKNMLMVKAEGGTIYYSAKDLPLFHCFQIPELMKFKLFYFLKTMLSRKEMVSVSFSEFEVNPEHAELCRKIYEAYSQINSVEIWNYETAHSLIAQISYYNTVGFTNQEETELLYEKVGSLLQHLLGEAENEQKTIIGKKAISNQSNFKLFFNEVLAADNSIYAEIGNRQAAFMPHIILNYITTFDVEYCNYIRDVFQSVMKKSTLISGVNEKDRNLFFKYNFERLNAAKL